MSLECGKPRRAKRGEATALMNAIISTKHGRACVIWPFARNVRTGYATCYDPDAKRSMLTHRQICVAVNGEPPTPKHEAGHTCENGPGGCVNPEHLHWVSRSENMLECSGLGLKVRGRKHPRVKLTVRQVRAIRRSTKTIAHLSRQYKVGRTTVAAIVTKRNWGWLC